jgi:hypothetical protein
MSYYKYGLSADPSFQMGMALGNAYGNLWASNAKKRNEAQMDEVVKQYMDDQRMQQLANPIEEKPLMTEAINGNYASDNTNGINNNISGISKFNRSYGLATPQNIIDEAKRRGIHQEVIDERMKGVREQIASKAKAQYMPQINQLIYGSMDANGNYVAPTQADYLKASGLIDDYRKYDTVGADKLTETLNNRQLGQLQHLANRQQKLDDYRFAVANGMGGKGDNSQQVNIALSRMKVLDGMRENNNGILPAEFENEYRQWQSVLGIQRQPTAEEALVAELSKDGANQDEIFANFKATFGDGELYQSMYKKYYKPKQAKQVEQKQNIKAQPNEDEVSTNDFNFREALDYARSKGLERNQYFNIVSANTPEQRQLVRSIEEQYELPYGSLTTIRR